MPSKKDLLSCNGRICKIGSCSPKRARFEKSNLFRNSCNYDNKEEIDEFFDIFTSWGENIGGVYKITSLENNKSYIGITAQETLTKRMYGHTTIINSDSNEMLIDVIMRHEGVIRFIPDDTINGGYFVDKHDIKKFIVEIIDYGKNIEDLCEKEKKWIEHYKTYIYDWGTQFGYNQTRGGEAPFIGEENPQYKHIDEEQLKSLIKSGYNAWEIADELKIAAETVGKKAKEFWGKTLPEAREEFGGADAYNKRVRKLQSESAKERGFSEKWRESASIAKRGANNINYVPIDKDTLQALIMTGCSIGDIAETLQIDYSTVYDKMVEFWNTSSIIELRRLLGVKRKKEVHPQYKNVDRERLKELILKGYSMPQIAKELDILESLVQSKIKEYWGMNLRDLQKAWNVKTWHEKTWEEKSLNVEISKFELEKLILEGLSSMEIAREFGVSVGTIYNTVKEFWGTNFGDLVKKWDIKKSRKKVIPKDELEQLIRDRVPMEKIREHFNVGQGTIYRAISEYWDGMTYGELKKHWNLFINEDEEQF